MPETSDVKIGFKASNQPGIAFLVIERQPEAGPDVLIPLTIGEVTQLCEISSQVVEILATEVQFGMITENLELELDFEELEPGEGEAL